MTEKRDEADARRVLRGELEAFTGIVNRWQGRLVTLAYRFCRNRHTAEEMAQTAFIKVYRGLKQRRTDAPFSSWIMTVAANSFRSAMRRHRLPTLPITAAEDIQALKPPPNDVDQRDNDVRNAVANLRNKYRDVIILFYFGQHDLVRTAETLGLREGTVKARLHRGRAMLRQKLEPLRKQGHDESERSNER